MNEPRSPLSEPDAVQPGAVQPTFAATLVDEWVRAGITDAVVCPGSRSTPLVLALASRRELRLHGRLDERSGGFFALGLAIATGRPVVVCVTSGTAAVELHPAVVEAHHARVPLLVCTADRPPELHGIGAPQTIEQRGLYGDALRWSASPGVPDASTAASWRSLAARAVAEASEGPFGPGPVHLNFAFREPLVGEPGPLPAARAGTTVWHRFVAAPASAEPEPWGSGRGVILAGRGAGTPEAVLALSEHLGWPVLADALSGCRLSHPNVVASADALARHVPASLRPDTVVRLGTSWLSKALPALLAGAETVAVDPWCRWDDPTRDAALHVRADTTAWVEGAMKLARPATPEGWLEAWQAAERSAQAAIDDALGADELSEPLLARHLLLVAPPGATVLVSASMPLRDLEWFAPALPAPPRVVANRGVNGIDGVVSTALGLAASGTGHVLAALGDLAFFHDVGALVASASEGPRGSCILVVVDNAGGGIFEFLPQAGAIDRDRFELLFATPQSTDVVEAARGLGARVADVGTPSELAKAIGAAARVRGVTVVRARVLSRRANVEVHERVHAAVGRALRVAG